MRMCMYIFLISVKNVNLLKLPVLTSFLLFPPSFPSFSLPSLPPLSLRMEITVVSAQPMTSDVIPSPTLTPTTSTVSFHFMLFYFFDKLCVYVYNVKKNL